MAACGALLPACGATPPSPLAVACCAAAATAFVPGPVSMRVPRAALAMSSTPLGVEPLPTAGPEVLAGVDGDLIVDLDSLADCLLYTSDAADE